MYLERLLQVGNMALAVAIAMHLLAIILFLKQYKKAALFLLVCGAAVLRYYFTELDIFLHDWDERFHALVAANLSKHLLKPTLLDEPLLGYYPDSWVSSHVWLHKQPLFLWQMALSIKVFGRNEFALRLPSLIQTSLLVAVIYDLGKQVASERTGFLAAVLLSMYQPMLDMVGGLYGMDHNDVAFCFYITLSLWSWVRFEKSRQPAWLFAAGVFSGGAVLVKWLTGLLLFFCMAVYHLLKRNLFTKDVLLQITGTFLLAVLVFLPWQLYVFHTYPVEAFFEFKYNARHFTEVLEGHGAEKEYYFNQLKFHYKMLQAFIFVGMAGAFWQFRQNVFLVTFIAGIAAVYAFFTMAESKLWNYPMMVMPLMLLFLALGLNYILDLLPGRQWSGLLFAAVTITAGFWMLDAPKIYEEHFSNYNWNAPFRNAKSPNAVIMKKWAASLPPDAIVANFPSMSEIDFMFYSNRTAFGSLNHDQLLKLLKLNRPIYWVNTPPPASYGLNDRLRFLPEHIQ
ncbi:MAG: glycosyltransferase family 39 protein [Chitinophagales bacterium]